MIVYALVLFSSILYSQCDDYNYLECGMDQSCEWIQDIEYGNCSQLSESSCDSNPNCYYDCEFYHGSCAGCCYGSCLGGTYEVDNSYCEESLTGATDCSELDELLCSDDNYAEECEWNEEASYINCNTLSDWECTNFNVDAVGTGCWLQQGECIQWGSWYTWMCYEYDYQCSGGIIQVNTSYCEEIEYELGDMNGDYLINILDVIESINLILIGDYSFIADINDDNNLNILDIIILIDMILDN